MNVQGKTVLIINCECTGENSTDNKLHSLYYYLLFMIIIVVVLVITTTTTTTTTTTMMMMMVMMMMMMKTESVVCGNHCSELEQ